MYRYTKIFCLTILLIFTLSCSKDNTKNISEDFSIEFETVCGWNVGHKFMAIKKGEIKYGDKHVSDKIRPISDKEWNELLESFDTDYFKSLDYNICNICLDGCDEFIRIVEPGLTHQISYNPGDTIPGIEDLQEKLRKYLAEYYNEN